MRYRLLSVVAAFLLIVGLSGASLALDLKSLNDPPGIGEMALGPEDAKVTIIEYYSASCSHCATFHKETFSVLRRDYIDHGRIRFVLREYPLDKASLAASMLARCAPKEKFFAIIDALFETQDAWTKKPATGLRKVARFSGFIPVSFDDCLDSRELAEGILAIRNKAAKEFGVTSTPTLFINGERLTGERDIATIKSIIDPILGK
ncbi:DsbA family protein [Taklimakanibacter lacteus]|uniref:DsbA family protein n=1 Tax=Taklimakanibacter lacteus TaxID=2268456 RepID=UPI000E660253